MEGRIITSVLVLSLLGGFTGSGVMKGLEKFLTRDRDRELFGLDPMPESTPEGRT